MDGIDLQAAQRQLKMAGYGAARAYIKQDFREAGRQTDKEIQDQFRLLPWEPGLYSDQATSEDGLGFERWVKTELAMLLNERLQTPVSMCIAGPWGCGKSSFMRMIQRHIEILKERRRESLLCVWIDPARAGSRAEVVSLFAESLRHEANELARELETVPERALYGLDNQFVSDEVKKQTMADVSEWVRSWGTAKAGATAWSTERFIELIRDTRWALLGRHGLGRVFLLVDDLDRCDPDIVLEVLRIHRALLGEWGVVLVFAMDYDVVAQIVGRQFSQGNVGVPLGSPETTYFNWFVGQRYLEKFFGRRIRPPEPSSGAVRNWLMALFSETAVSEELGKAVQLGFQANPRRIKHYVNICGDLFRGLELASSTDELWKPFMDLPRPEVRGLICKAVALALAWPDVFEVARATEAQALAYAEQAAITGRPVPRIRRRMFGELRADDGLIALMHSNPHFRDRPPTVLEALIAACDPYLGSSVLRYELSGETDAGTLLIPASEEGTDKVRPVTPEDASRVKDILDEWTGMLSVPAGVLQVLEQVPAPTPGIELFRGRDFSPAPQALVFGAVEGFNGGNVRVGQWMAAAATVAPSAGVEDYLALVLLLEDLPEQQEFLSQILAVGEERLQDSDERRQLLQRRLRAMQRTGNPGTLAEATNVALDRLGINLDELKLSVPQLAEGYEAGLVLAAADLLAAQNLFHEELALCRAAIASVMSSSDTYRRRMQELPDLFRSLGRAHRHLNDLAACEQMYGASMIRSVRQEQAVTWYLALMEAHGDEARVMMCRLTLVDRDPLDPEYWLEAGIAVNNHGDLPGARTWLERAVELDPENAGYRRALAHNVRFLEGVARAAAVQNREFVPKPDIGQCLLQAREAHERLLAAIISRGIVEDNGIVLLDPVRLPAWVCERFPRLCTINSFDSDATRPSEHTNVNDVVSEDLSTDASSDEDSE